MDAAPPNPARMGFYLGLRREVFSFLEQHALDPIDQRGMLRKALLCYTLWAVFYAGFLFLGRGFGWHALWMLLPLAFAQYCIQLGVMHDGSHGTFSRSRLGNRLARWSLAFAGASPSFWRTSHVQMHHGNTNVKGFDQDFESGGLIRLHPSFPRHPAHRYQHVYAPLLYMFQNLKWFWWDDCKDIIVNRWSWPARKRRAVLLAMLPIKLWHIAIYVAVPALVSQSLALALVFYLGHWMLLGLVMSLTFLMAHMTGVQVTCSDKGEELDDWALHQLATTANFATGNRVLTWIVGGLNLQIEHHIFPKFSSTRHRLIQPLVKDYCRRHGVRYIEYPSLRAVLCDHFRNLRRLGSCDVVPPVGQTLLGASLQDGRVEAVR